MAARLSLVHDFSMRWSCRHKHLLLVSHSSGRICLPLVLTGIISSFKLFRLPEDPKSLNAMPNHTKGLSKPGHESSCDDRPHARSVLPRDSHVPGPGYYETSSAFVPRGRHNRAENWGGSAGFLNTSRPTKKGKGGDLPGPGYYHAPDITLLGQVLPSWRVWPNERHASLTFRRSRPTSLPHPEHRKPSHRDMLPQPTKQDTDMLQLQRDRRSRHQLQEDLKTIEALPSYADVSDADDSDDEEDEG